MRLSNVTHGGDNSPLRINTRKVLVTIGLPLGLLFAILTWSLVSAWLRVNTIENDEALRTRSIQHFTTFFLLISGGFLCVALPIAFLLRRMTRTYVREEGVLQVGLFRSTRVLWSQVVRVVRSADGSIRIVAESQSLVVPVSFYVRPEELTAYINERLDAITRPTP